MKKAKPAVRVAKPAQAPAAIIRPTVIETLEVALSRTGEASAAFADRLLVLAETRVIEQGDLHANQLFERVEKAADGPVVAFKKLAQQIYVDAEKDLPKGTTERPRLNVQSGPRVLTFEDNRRVNVSWKDQAIKHAEILHAASNALEKGDFAAVRTLLAPFRGEFNSTRWEEAIKAGLPKTGLLTPKVVEGV